MTRSGRRLDRARRTENTATAAAYDRSRDRGPFVRRDDDHGSTDGETLIDRDRFLLLDTVLFERAAQRTAFTRYEAPIRLGRWLRISMRHGRLDAFRERHPTMYETFSIERVVARMRDFAIFKGAGDGSVYPVIHTNERLHSSGYASGSTSA